MSNSYEFFPTPDPFTNWLFETINIEGRLCEPGVGDGAIIRASGIQNWKTNDLDPRWPADCHLDATKPELYDTLGAVDWFVGNPAFTIAVESAQRQITHASTGVVMHLRASIHEVLKTGDRRTWLAKQTPTGILWLPRFAYQRSPTTGKWTTDSVCACWVIWLKDPDVPQFIRYAPERVLRDLDTFTPAYRKRMDALMLEIDPIGYGALLKKAA